jgi:hypothetical protein
MRDRPLNADPLGRLHEPLHDLATRVHRGLGSVRKTLWADGSGRVFKENVVHAVPTSLHWIVGTYDAHTPVWLIEDDLRHALRARASVWITDWETIQPAIRHQLIRPRSSNLRRGRPGKATAALTNPQGSPMMAEDHRPSA